MAGTIDFADCPQCGREETLVVDFDSGTLEERVYCAKCGYEETTSTVAAEDAAD